MNETLERCRRNLVRRGFEARIAATTEEARQILWEKIRAAAPETICFGDSMTMKATGIVDDLHRDGHYRLFDGFDPAMPRPQKLEIRRQGLLADLFITGINAVTEDGALLWLDMIGNRIAPIAPQNIARHPGFRTPCAVTGVCADCYSEDRICNTHLRMERCFPRKRITVVLIDEDLGL